MDDLRSKQSFDLEELNYEKKASIVDSIFIMKNKDLESILYR